MSLGSEESEFSESDDSASADECEGDGVDYRLCSEFNKCLSYGPLVATNLVVEGVLHLDSRKCSWKTLGDKEFTQFGTNAKVD